MMYEAINAWLVLFISVDAVNATIDGLRGLNGMLEGTALPRLKTDKIEELIFRDTLPLLGLD